MLSREMAWVRLSRPLDMLVIGGGVTGAGVLLEAARRGLRAALVERGDFASGTSSRSSKLVHGGLRYLKEGKFRLTRESVAEREALLREAPGLVEPMPFLMPEYANSKPGRFITQAGLMLYDALARRRSRGFIDARQALEQEPSIAPDGLRGAHVFEDATTDDARLVLRLLAEAERFSACAINYAEVTTLETNGRVRAAVVRDSVGQRLQRVEAQMLVNATGVFADHLRGLIARAPKLRPLRGSHLLVAQERLPLSHAVAFSHPADARPVFAYPWMGMTLAGTTDLDHWDDLRNEPGISSEEFQYLMDALAHEFPRAAIARSDVVSTFSGIRPVVAGGSAAPSGESRDHLLLEERGLVTITGGKLTTFRPMALQALEAACKSVDRIIDTRPARIFAEAFPTSSSRLNGRYGASAADIIEIRRIGDADLVASTETTWGELRYGMRSECVVHMDDLLLRRTRLGLQLRDGGAEIFERLRGLFAEELQWDDARWEDECAAYRDRIRAHYSVPA